MDLCGLTREAFEPRELQRCVAPQCCILTGVKHGEPHQLIAQGWRVLEQHNVLADSCSAPSVDLACDVIGRNVEGSKLVAMNGALTYSKAAQFVMMLIYPRKHGVSLEAATAQA
jgi:hypothetical protein